MTAVNAPPTASVLGLDPGDAQRRQDRDRDRDQRIRKPTVPAVAGSMRRKNVGPAARPERRARCAQPSTTTSSTVAMPHLDLQASSGKMSPRRA